MNDWSYLDGERGRYVRRGDAKQRSAESTPGYTPTTSTSHLPRPRPRLYEAALNGHVNQLVAIKTVEESGQDYLIREFHALSTLKDVSCVPSVMEFNYDRSLAFVALEYLGDDWVSLDKDIQTRKPFRERYVGDEDFQQLQKSLEVALSKIHRKGVAHGDLKSNHIFIKKRFASLNAYPSNEYELDYSEIKIIDFGASYLMGETSKWHGGSIGFSNPYHWHPNHRDGLQFKELKTIDWYSVNAILFHSYTGECFPVASPAYRLFVDKGASPDINLYFNQLEKNVLSRFGGSEALVQIIHNLCFPKEIVFSEKKFMNDILAVSNGFDYKLTAPLICIFILLLGQLLRSPSYILPIGFVLVLFMFVIILFGKKDVNQSRASTYQKNNIKNLWVVNAIVFLGVVTINIINITFVPKLLPIIVLTSTISILVIVISLPLFRKPLSSVVEGLLLLGLLGSISIPVIATIIIIPILMGLGFRYLPIGENRLRIFSYIYLLVTSIVSSFGQLAVNVSSGAEVFNTSIIGQMPYQLLMWLGWCLIAELVNFIVSYYKKRE